MSREISSLERGGLAQIISPRGSATWFALGSLNRFLQASPSADPPLSLWISDEGFLYPPSLFYFWKIPLARFLQVKVNAAKEVWREGLEGIQTGLFRWIFLRPSQACEATYLRKLQLGAERTQSQVFLLCKTKLPHWMLKTRIELDEHETHSLFSKRSPSGDFPRSLSLPHSKSFFF